MLRVQVRLSDFCSLILHVFSLCRELHNVPRSELSAWFSQQKFSRTSTITSALLENNSSTLNCSVCTDEVRGGEVFCPECDKTLCSEHTQVIIHCHSITIGRVLSQSCRYHSCIFYSASCRKISNHSKLL